MKTEKDTISIDELREWLRHQLNERVSGEGIRAVAKAIGVHENTLYGIIKGRKPNYRTSRMLREYHRRVHGQS